MSRGGLGWLLAVGRTLTRILALLGLIVLVVIFTPIVSWWGSALAGPWDDAKGEVLVVLGGSSLGNGTRILGESSYWRSVYTVLAYREGGFHDIVLSGGGDSLDGVADLMRDFLVCQGVPAAAIHLETRSRSTRENAVYTKEILNALPGRKVLLTSDYHMTRAAGAFKHEGIALLRRPVPDALKRGESFAGRWGAFVDVVRETTALAYYKIRGWT